MALSTTEQAKIRYWLGFNEFVYSIPRDQLTQRMQSASADVVTEAQAVLAALVVVETQRGTNIPAAGIKAVDEVTFQDGANAQFASLNSYGRQQVSRLESLFGIPRDRDVFAAGPASGPLALG